MPSLDLCSRARAVVGHVPGRGDHPFDGLFQQLSHPLRRRVLRELAGADALDVAALAAGSDPERARLQLHHVPLPKLAAAGYVEWDPDSGTLARAPRFGAVEPVLGLISGDDGVLPADAV